ncbi:MAG: D-alanyl-D-alanine carboxypeptidase family protein [Pacificimonas sp.]
MRFAALSVLALAFAAPAVAQSLETAAPFAYVKDLSSGMVLFKRSADEKMPPASMAKMMTTLVAFDLVDSGKLALDDKFTVRPDTWTKWHSQGSTMFLSSGEEVSVENLLHGIVTASGNDASVVLAEGIAGTEGAFADVMNAKGKAIGLTGTNFETANGWPDDDEHVTPRDLAVIAERTILDHPELYAKFYGMKEFTWGKTLGGGNPITQPNRNPILNTVKGADGLKTGHTEAAGYGFTGSAARDGRRVVAVISGLTSEAQRRSEATRIMEWAFGAFEGKTLEPGKILATAPVHMGATDSIGLKAAEGAALTLPKAILSDTTAKIVYKSPLQAPIAKGDIVGELHVKAGGLPVQKVKLVAAEAVPEAGFFGRVVAGFGRLFD